MALPAACITCQVRCTMITQAQCAKGITYDEWWASRQSMITSNFETQEATAFLAALQLMWGE